MTRTLTRTSLAVALWLGSTALASAAPFTWTPRAVSLHGASFTAATLILADYAQITFTDGGTRFEDRGFLPVVGFSLNGQAVMPSGYGTADGWGAYVQYVGRGTQSYYAPGIPQAATFETLTYQIVGYNGPATFGFDAVGVAIIEDGATSNRVTLETGSLIGGSLNFVPGPTGLTIMGVASTTIDTVNSRFVQGTAGQFEVTFVHPPEEYGFSSLTTLQIMGRDSSSATLVPRLSTSVPEPWSLALLGGMLVGVGLLRSRVRQPGS